MQAFDKMQYCVRCCMPETQEGLTFDELGICQACQSSEQKMHIDWKAREGELRKLLETAKAKAGSNYDCILPISGGKDSTFQCYVLTQVYGMKPLAVTFSQNWQSKTGWYNLQNTLEQFKLDHIMWTPNRDLVNRLARRSLKVIGDACWHCHWWTGAFPLQIAAKFKIPLVIYGESAADSSGRDSYAKSTYKFDREYFKKISAKVGPEAMVCDYISERDVSPFNIPSFEEVESVGVYGIHLGNYIFWDEERQTEFVREHYGWRETEMENTYKGYKSAECIMSGIHDFTCYLKRGFGRATVQACTDIRQGLLTRKEGFELATKLDGMRPEALDYYLEITGVAEDEFYTVMEKHRIPALRNALGDKEIPVRPKSHKNAETIKPFMRQLIDEMKDLPDPREKLND